MTTASQTRRPVPPAYPLAEMTAVEVFEVGTHRGRVYSEADLDELVRNFDRFGPRGLNLLTPTAALGHEEDQRFLDMTDIPSAGTVARLYRQGPKLLADFRDVPQPIAALIAAKAYRKPSIEHYDQDRPFDAGNGQVFTDKILRRVAFLGAEQPQVKTLKDLPVPVFQYGDRYVVPWTSPAGPCFAFSETKPVTRADKIAKLRTDKRYASFAKCFADGEGGAVTVDRAALIGRIKGALPAVDQATLDSMTDDQLVGLALAAPAPVVPAETVPMEEVPFDRAAVIAELVAAGQDAVALDAMTDDDLRALLAKVKGGAPAPVPMGDRKANTFSDQQRAALDQSRRLNAELEAANRRTAERLKQARKDEAHAFCDKMVREGRMTPADRDTLFVPQLLKADDASPTHKFSEGGREVSVTEYEAIRRTLAARPVVVQYGERLKAGGKQADANDEVEKVVRFSELHGDSLRRAGSDPKKMVATAKKMAESDPTFRAEVLIGRDGAALVG